ncbi:MAG: hypothetical protein E7302_04480 [Butyrivibrio sp.]|nr:hypothetical protein [Butyrivibrio sp.]
MTNDQKLDLVLEKVSSMDGRFDRIENRLDVIESDVGELKSDVRVLKSDVARINMRIENEICKGIAIIGEGHSDLSRNLQTVIKTKEEDNLLVLRVNHLEAQMQEVLAKIS